MLSEHTYELCKENIWVRELDLTRVKGKRKPVKIYELIDSRDKSLDDGVLSFLDLYQTGREAYTSANFQQAIQLFEQAEQARPFDKAVQIHLERARAYLQAPPPSDWDGVHTMTTK